jgi:thioredoxin-related protein
MRNVVTAIALLLLSIGVYSFKNSNNSAEEIKPGAGIQWISWGEMVEKSKKEQRKVVVDVYTDWCGWCKRMDATTFQQAQIAKYVNKNYYAVKFNAEDKQDIDFKGRTFKFVKNGMRGYHELAAEITRGRLSYPTVVFLDEKLEVIQSIPGYRDAAEFEKIVTYFGENQHQKTPWETYQKNYQPMKVD